MENIEINLLIEKEGNTFIASSPEINVFAEGKTIDEAKDKFISGVSFYFESFPEDKQRFIEKDKLRMPIIQKVLIQC